MLIVFFAELMRIMCLLRVTYNVQGRAPVRLNPFPTIDSLPLLVMVTVPLRAGWRVNRMVQLLMTSLDGSFVRLLVDLVRAFLDAIRAEMPFFGARFVPVVLFLLADLVPIFLLMAAIK